MIVVKATVICKDNSTEIRRLPMSRLPGELTYDELCIMLHRLFKKHIPSIDNLVLKYADEDGDKVCLESDLDITHALSQNSVLRVHVFDKTKPSQSQDVVSSELETISSDQRRSLIDAVADLQVRIDGLTKVLAEQLGPAKGFDSDSTRLDGGVTGDKQQFKTSDIAEFLSPTLHTPSTIYSNPQRSSTIPRSASTSNTHPMQNQLSSITASPSQIQTLNIPQPQQLQQMHYPSSQIQQPPQQQQLQSSQQPVHVHHTGPQLQQLNYPQHYPVYTPGSYTSQQQYYPANGQSIQPSQQVSQQQTSHHLAQQHLPQPQPPFRNTQ
ncbi:hypothetical protein O5D80_002957 [Batrachochytrium dendrobatidis]|nr:hypothetical protein O5D80_002957 [Batrachochytrium dendrobatidis]